MKRVVELDPCLLAAGAKENADTDTLANIKLEADKNFIVLG